MRSKGEAAYLQYRDLSGSLKMLILADPSADLKSAYHEGLNIKNQFNHKTRKVQVDFKSTHIDKHYVKKNICDYDIVHFAGHCEFDKAENKDSGWVLSDGVFNTLDIQKMGSSCSMPALVFSNACHSAQAGTGASLSADPRSSNCNDPGVFHLDSEYQKVNYGMASAFLFTGVRHYIGSIRKIEDKASMVFAREFYSRLISGISVGESLRLSKLKLIQDYGLNSLHWVNYLLYGDPGFIFFKPSRSKKPAAKIIARYKKIIFKVCLFMVLGVLSIFLILWLPKINPSKYYLLFNADSEYRRGNNQKAVVLGQRTMEKDQDLLGAYPIVAGAYQNLGNKEKALKFYSEYMLKSEKSKSLSHQLDAYIKLGWFYQLDGQYPKALELYEKALSLSRQTGDRQVEALALRKLAVWNIDKDNFDQALDLLTKSAVINQEYPGKFENIKNLACDYFDIGLVFTNKNDYPAAKNFYEKSQKLFEKLKLDNELSDCYYNLGEIHFYEKQYQKALDYYFKGLKLDQKQNNKVNLASGYNMIAELYLEIDDLTKAEEYLRQSISLSEQINNRMDLAAASYNLGLLYKKQGRKNLAREYWRKAQEIYRQADQEKYQQIRKELLELNEN